MHIKSHIYKTCEDLEIFDIRKPAHISSINLQVECAPLRKCARPRLAVCTEGAAKTRKRTNNQHQKQPNILLLRMTL